MEYISACCKSKMVTSSSDEGTSYFICTHCQKACDFFIEIEEKWKPINGFNGYEISNTGKVRSFIQKHGELKQSIAGTGYLQVGLRKDNKSHARRIHCLVAEHFIGKRKKHRVINHINGIRQDNRVENLEYCTQKENIIKYYTKNHKKDCPLCKKYFEHIKMIDKYSL